MKEWIHRYFIGPVGAGVIQALGMSFRLEMEDPHGFLKQTNRGPVLFAFWHNRLLMMPYLYRHSFPDRRMAVMISRSRDGQIIASVVDRFGIGASRGSTSKKGSSAFRDMAYRVMELQSDAGVTPDGPRGPCYHLQPGILHLSQLTQCPIIPITYEAEWKKVLKSWDRFQIPYPGTRIRVKLGAPLQVPEDADDAVLADYTSRLTAALQDEDSFVRR